MKRLVKPELLDQLPPEDPRAKGSRRDLERLNSWMGNRRLTADALRPVLAAASSPRLAEVGSGDGKFFLGLAVRLGRPPGGGSAALVDRLDLLAAPTRSRLSEIGWTAEPVTADVFTWLKTPPAGRFDVLLANLFLHHFPEPELREMFALASERADCFMAVEPRRSGTALAFGCLVRFIGCNEVTRHDAPVSVRAGFRGRELSRLWPGNGAWSLEEREAGLFSHLFVARRRTGTANS